MSQRPVASLGPSDRDDQRPGVLRDPRRWACYQEAGDREYQRRQRCGGEGGTGADDARDPAERRAQKRSGGRGRGCDADQLPAALARAFHHQPRERTGPCERGTDALTETCSVEQPDGVAKAKTTLNAPSVISPTIIVGLTPTLEAKDAAGDRAREAARAVGADQDARLELGQTEGLFVVGEKRRDRCEEHRLDQKNRPDEQQKARRRASDSTLVCRGRLRADFAHGGGAVTGSPRAGRSLGCLRHDRRCRGSRPAPVLRPPRRRHRLRDPTRRSAGDGWLRRRRARRRRV